MNVVEHSRLYQVILHGYVSYQWRITLGQPNFYLFSYIIYIYLVSIHFEFELYTFKY